MVNSFVQGSVLFRHSPVQRQRRAGTSPGASPSLHPPTFDLLITQALARALAVSQGRGKMKGSVSITSRASTQCSAAIAQTSQCELQDLSDLALIS